MKKLLAIIVLGLVSVTAFSNDQVAVNGETIQTFMGIFPLFKSIVKQHGDNPLIGGTELLGKGYRDELQQALSPYQLSLETFSLLLQKITAGLSVVRVQDEGMSTDAMGLTQSAGLSEKELRTIKKYQTPLSKLLGME